MLAAHGRTIELKRLPVHFEGFNALGFYLLLYSIATRTLALSSFDFDTDFHFIVLKNNNETKSILLQVVIAFVWIDRGDECRYLRYLRKFLCYNL